MSHLGKDLIHRVETSRLSTLSFTLIAAWETHLLKSWNVFGDLCFPNDFSSLVPDLVQQLSPRLASDFPWWATPSCRRPHTREAAITATAASAAIVTKAIRWPTPKTVVWISRQFWRNRMRPPFHLRSPESWDVDHQNLRWERWVIEKSCLAFSKWMLH